MDVMYIFNLIRNNLCTFSISEIILFDKTKEINFLQKLNERREYTDKK